MDEWLNGCVEEWMNGWIERKVGRQHLSVYTCQVAMEETSNVTSLKKPSEDGSIGFSEFLVAWLWGSPASLSRDAWKCGSGLGQKIWPNFVFFLFGLKFLFDLIWHMNCFWSWGRLLVSSIFHFSRGFRCSFLCVTFSYFVLLLRKLFIRLRGIQCLPAVHTSTSLGMRINHLVRTCWGQVLRMRLSLHHEDMVLSLNGISHWNWVIISYPTLLVYNFQLVCSPKG